MVTSVDVIVPVFGNYDLTSRCLTTLSAQTHPHRVIVVDDGSPDQSAQRVRDTFPDVDVIALPQNRGFVQACNAGFGAGKSDVVILLNNDVELLPAAIAALVGALDANPEAASAAPILLQPSGLIDAWGIAADPTLAGFLRGRGLTTDGVRTASLPMLLGPYGAVACYRRSALQEIGFLDPKLVMYGEELDLAIRLAQGGWDSVAVDAVAGTHLGGATAGVSSPTQRYRSGFSRGYLLRRYGVLRGRFALRALVTELIVSVSHLVRYRDSVQLRGRFDGWRAAQPLPRPRALAASQSGIGFVDSLRMRANNNS